MTMRYEVIFQEGFDAYNRDMPATCCPYPASYEADDGSAWLNGWQAASRQYWAQHR
jgi:ribosome modulation factor